MANTTTSVNMGYPIPVVSTDPGPDYAVHINECLTTIDAHDHTSGNGVLITPSAININTALPFGGNNATQLRTAAFNLQGSPITGSASTDVGCIYFAGVDLYANDGAGNTVRITQTGGVAGSPGSISNLASPASASYVSASGKFVWQRGVTLAADIDCRSVLLRNTGASSNALTLNPPSSMASNFSLTLPNVSSATSFMALDSSGNMSAFTPTAQGITRAMMAAVGQFASNASGAFNTSSGTFGSVTNLSGTLTTTGRPVMLFLQPSGSGASRFFAINTAGDIATMQVRLLRNGSTVLAQTQVSINASTNNAEIDTADIQYLDIVSAGTYTWSIEAKLVTGTNSGVEHFQLVGYEL